MKWEVITNERSSLQEYRLIDNTDCKVVIKYNPLHQSARITSGNHHRLFFLESAGSLSGKTIFKNEYGMEIGNLVHDSAKSGTLVIDTKKYLYQLHSNPLPEMIIFENNLQKRIASCSFPTSQTSLQKSSSNNRAIDNNCYLLGICWYLFLPSGKENILEYASSGF